MSITRVSMVPLRRSGSHALRLRLNQHPGFSAPYPLHIVDFVPRLPKYGNLSEDGNYFHLVHDVIQLQNLTPVRWSSSFDPYEVFDALKDKTRSIHMIVWYLHTEHARRCGATVAMDKACESIMFVEEILELFPDMKFINLVRDPRAQISSINKAIIHHFGTELNLQLWVDTYSRAKKLEESHPKQVLRIYFEDFVADEKKVLENICSFCGLDFLPSMLHGHRSEEAQDLSRRSALWENNTQKPNADMLSKFQKTLSDTEIAMIETSAGELMDYYGYPRLSNRNVTRLVNRSELLGQDVVLREQAFEKLKASNMNEYIMRQARRSFLKS